MVNNESFLVTVVFVMNELLMQISLLQLVSAEQVVQMGDDFKFLTVAEYCQTHPEVTTGDLSLLGLNMENTVFRYGRFIPSTGLRSEQLRRI